ncbi:SUMF1/EgtB/PvdO family nonheme iron enzyme [Streptomyces cellulosae]|uniref:SUMF1/EgtB/PvdO family nonheme iron enzyme n=1 Tax=Streptomyces cellulosae TaxID=1968 RepID=A0ABW7YI44_STRCE
MLATLQLGKGAPVLHAPAPADAAGLPREVLLSGGSFTRGASAEPWALDNERPQHTVDVPAFWLDTVPVTNAACQEFIEADGYHDPKWWTPGGWLHIQATGIEAPLLLAPGARTVAAAPVRCHRGGPRRRARAARVLV